MKIFLKLLTTIVVFIAVGGYSCVFAAINFTITPIKYELNLQPGESITLPASIRNNGSTPVTLPTTASDFQSNGTTGVPSFVRKSELVFPNQQLSTWITISQTGVTLAPGEEKSVNFTIDVPATATPGGHYGAILFKNDNSDSSSNGNIGINVDYGIIILINVDGEIVVDVDISDPIIGGSGIVKYDKCDGPDTSGSIFDGECGDSNEGSSNTTGNNTTITNSNLIPWYIGKDDEGNPIYEFPDDCPFGDFTSSRYDNSCLKLSYPVSEKNITNESNGSLDFNNTDGNDDFDVSFLFPVKNKGNTHIKPTGKITLKDESGNTLKAIGKKNIINDAGAIIGEKIVDYIPINDNGGNILPYSQRIFESEWKGFPYKDFDETGEPVIQYWSPSEYYTRKNQKEAGFLMFWERVSEVRTHKKITALVELIYNDANGNPIEFNTAQEFPVQYIEQKVTINLYIILGLLLLTTTILMSWFGIRWYVLTCKKQKCWNCKEKIKSHWKTCPHCNAIQDKKKHKELEKLLEEEKKNKPTSPKTPKKRGRPRKNPENKK